MGMEIVQNITRMSEPEVVNTMNKIIGIPQMIMVIITSLIIFFVVGNSLVKQDKGKLNLIIIVSHVILLGVVFILALNPNLTYNLWNFFSSS